MSDKYWDVIGDGWNPGHTMTEEEIAFEKSTLSCFGTGRFDEKRGIYWKYADRPTDQPKFTHTDATEIAERLILLATQAIDECHIYEVENVRD